MRRGIAFYLTYLATHLLCNIHCGTAHQFIQGRADYELAVRTVFLNLLAETARQVKWMLIPEQTIEGGIRPDGVLLISGGSDGMLRWWEIHSGQCVRVQKGHQGTVQALKVSPDESLLASCGDDGAIVLWDLQCGEPLQTLRRDRPYERLNITGIRGLSAAQKTSLRVLGAFEKTNVL